MAEFEALGRTKLRVELKLRGLSPSGLKDELMSRLMQHLASPAALEFGLTPLVTKLGYVHLAPLLSALSFRFYDSSFFRS